MYLGLVGLVRRQHSYPPDQGSGQEPGQGHNGGNFSPSYGNNNSGSAGGGGGAAGSSSIFGNSNRHRRGLLSSIGTYTAIPLRY